MSGMTFERHAWWIAALEWAGDRRSLLVPLRDLGDPLTTRPAWVITSASGLESGQLGVAELVSHMLWFRPDGLSDLFASLSCWRTADDIAAPGQLWRTLTPLWSEWARRLVSPRTVPAAQVPRLLHLLGEVLPDIDASGDEQSRLQREARDILAYRHRTTHLGDFQRGVFLAAEWASGVRAERLSRILTPTQARELFLDITVLAIVACQKVRRLFASRGEVLAHPDLSVMRSASPVAPRASERVRPPTLTPPGPGQEGHTSSRPAHALPTPPRAAAETPSPPGLADETPAPPTPAAEPPAAPSDNEREAWWVQASDWARGERTPLLRLLDLATHFPTRPMWPLLDFELKHFGGPRAARFDERPRLALASLLQEFFRVLPHHYGPLLDTLDFRDTPVDFERCGRLWMLLDPLFTSWARSLAGEGVAQRDEARRLHELGDIVPWMSPGKDQDPERERTARIDLAYHGPSRPSAEASRQGAYFAAVQVRNDVAHNKPLSLRGRVPALDLFRDITVLASLAALRFRRKLAEANPYLPPSVPALDCISVGPHRLRAT